MKLAFTYPNATTLVLKPTESRVLDPALFESLLEQISSSSRTNVILDMSGIKYIDSMTLGMLVTLARTLKFQGQEFSIANPESQIMETFHVTQLNILISTVPLPDTSPA